MVPSGSILIRFQGASLASSRMFIVFLYIGVTHRHLSDHMSDMVENTLNDLEQSKVQYECQLIIDTELSTL